MSMTTAFNAGYSAKPNTVCPYKSHKLANAWQWGKIHAARDLDIQTNPRKYMEAK
jgi:ribosome modulation factor